MATSFAQPIAERAWLDDAPLDLSAAAAVTTEGSIAASQILMGMALVAMFAARTKLRWPSAAWPLMAWVALTLVSFAHSGDMRNGLPQIKKIYVYLMLFLVASAVDSVRQIWWITLAWA